MDLTAESLQQVKFGAKVRGYDPEEVDRFIAEVTELGEELHERLRRATDRAARAEQQLATVANQPRSEPAPPAAPVTSRPDLSRIWEQAAAAAEAAVDEARSEAARILEDARRTSDDAVDEARRNAEAMVEETQGQLRADIGRLEGARDQLKSDVDGLGDYLSEQKGRLRDAMVRALSAVDEYGSGGEAPPVLSQVDVPAEQSVTRPGQPNAPVQQPEQQWQQPEQAQWSPPAQVTETEDDGDPFLAELRRAVRDDGPLGPREDDDDEETDSIDRLYSSDEGDSGFFRRKRQ